MYHFELCMMKLCVLQLLCELRLPVKDDIFNTTLHNVINYIVCN